MSSSPNAVKVEATKKGFNLPPILLRISQLTKMKMPKNVRIKPILYKKRPMIVLPMLVAITDLS